MTASFLENFTFLKKFLARYFKEQQDIEDVVQETYLRAYGSSQGARIENPKAFLFQIAKNLALNELQKKSRQVTEYLMDHEFPIDEFEPEFSTQSVVEASENIGIYCEAVAALPEKCRKVYLLRKVHGLSHGEISERLLISKSAVEKHLLKGVLKCRAYVNEREQGSSQVEATKAVKSVTFESRT